MSTKTKVLVAVLVLAGLIGGSFALGWGLEPEAPSAPAERRDVGTADPARAERSGKPEAPEPGRVAVESRADEEPAPAAETGAVVRGRLLDSYGRPMPHVDMQLCGFDIRKRQVGENVGDAFVTDAAGMFEVRVSSQQVVVPMAGDGYFTLRTTVSGIGLADESADCLVIAATAVALQGRVVDPVGGPVSGARVVPLTFTLAGFPLPLDQTLEPRRAAGATTGDDGRFEFGSVPVAGNIDLLAMCAGFESKRVASEDGRGGHLEITLTKLTATPGKITGTVLGIDGRPLRGAALRLGRDQKTMSASDGSFEFQFPGRPACLIATHAGLTPVVRRGVGERTPLPLLVEFREAARKISGRVVDTEGNGVAGLLVNVVDPESTPARAPLERLSSPQHERLPRGALGRTDADGRFVIDGLLDRDYRVRAWDQKTALSVQSAPVRAGSRDVELRVPADAFCDEVKGIVVDAVGAPVADARVAAHLVASFQDEFVAAHVAPVTTAVDGTFTLRRVPRRYVWISVGGSDVDYQKRAIEQCDVERGVRFEVNRLCYVQLEGPVGVTVWFLDKDGEALSASVESQGAAMSTNAWRMRDEKSPVLKVSQAAVTLRWTTREGKELGRKPIVLVPGGSKKVERVVVGQ